MTPSPLSSRLLCPPPPFQNLCKLNDRTLGGTMAPWSDN